MIDLIEEAERLQDFLESNGRNFYFIGGITVQVWGQPRLTQDIDLTVFTELENEAEFVAEMVEQYKPKFSSPTEFALTERILPLYSNGGIGIDLNLGGLSDTSSALARSSYQEFVGEIKLRILSAEDLLIAKTVANRPRDWIDVESVIIRQDKLDWPYVFAGLEDLLPYQDIRLEIQKLKDLKLQFYRK
jgi:hypothetical protein